MKIAIYAPYLETCGGGEKYVSHIAEALRKRNNVEFFALKKPCLDTLKERLNVDLSKFDFKLFSKNSPPYRGGLGTFKILVDKCRLSMATKSYDLFINQEHFTTIPSFARTAIVICEVPPPMINKVMFPNYKKLKASSKLLMKVMSKTFLDPKIDTYSKIITNSSFTKKWVERYYRKDVEVLYPPIDTEVIRPLRKHNIILNVGRFFVGNHNKCQMETIRFVKELFSTNKHLMNKWEYHLAGGVEDNSSNMKYLDECKREAKGYPIEFHINESFRNLKELYGRSRILIHATGAFENCNEHPDHAEHFGMVVAEAMSAGCVPLVISKGGLPEIVQNGVEGFLWSTEQDLKQWLLMLMTDEQLNRDMSMNSIIKSREFSIKCFQKRLKEILGNLA